VLFRTMYQTISLQLSQIAFFHFRTSQPVYSIYAVRNRSHDIIHSLYDPLTV
jgi:hypothetical protein